MNKEQRRRMAYQSIVAQQDEGQADIEYTVKVSGDRVEIHQSWENGFEDQYGEPDETHECWIMSKDTLKRLVKAAQWCIDKSEAFEAAHPPVPDEDPEANMESRLAAQEQQYIEDRQYYSSFGLH